MGTVDYISGIVGRLARKHDTRDPYELCRDLGIKIHREDLGERLKAYYFYERRIRNIVLNFRVDEVMLRVAAAHELGHACLHKQIAALKNYGVIDPFGVISPEETEANQFSAELLLRDDEVLDLLYYDDRTFFGIAKELYVPYPLLEYKLRILEHKGHDIVAPRLADSNFLKGKIAEDFADFC